MLMLEVSEDFVSFIPFIWPFFSSLLFENQLRQFFFSSLLLSTYFSAAAQQQRVEYAQDLTRTARTRETLTPEEEVSSHIDIKK